MNPSAIVRSLQTAGYDTLKAFLLDQSGKTLTEMAEVLEVPVQDFVAFHNAWVARHAPDPLQGND